MKWKVLLVALIGASMIPAFAQDPTKVDPEHYKVEGENEYVRVLRMTRGPHEIAPMHEHPADVVVFLTDVHEKVTTGDGKTLDIHRKAGDVQYHGPSKHSEENLADTPMEDIIIELKAPVHSAPLKDDLVTVDPKHTHVEIDNDRVRVLRVQRPAHFSAPLHSHPADVVVFMSHVHQIVTPKGGQPHEITRDRGHVSINKPSTHSETNLADQPMESLLVELK